jgi:hypothetical protein
MPYTERFSEVHEFLAGIPPASYTTEQNTGFVHFANYHRGVILIHAGAVVGTCDVDVEQAQDTLGTGKKAFDANAKDIVLTSGHNNIVAIIEIKSSEFDVANRYDCLNLEVTPGIQGSAVFGAGIFGLEPRYGATPATQVDSITD